jgi:hypothetical protein
MSDDEQQFEIPEEEEMDEEQMRSSAALPWFFQQPWTGIALFGAAVIGLTVIGRIGMSRYSKDARKK